MIMENRPTIMENRPTIVLHPYPHTDCGGISSRIGAEIADSNADSPKIGVWVRALSHAYIIPMYFSSCLNLPKEP